MYAKCESMAQPKRLFNEMPSQNVVIYTNKILGHMQKWRQGQKIL
jgi:hypothetical protein